MKKWFDEDYEFIIIVKNDDYKKCRLGFETGDVHNAHLLYSASLSEIKSATLAFDTWR